MDCHQKTGYLKFTHTNQNGGPEVARSIWRAIYVCRARLPRHQTILPPPPPPLLLHHGYKFASVKLTKTHHPRTRSDGIMRSADVHLLACAIVLSLVCSHFAVPVTRFAVIACVSFFIVYSVCAVTVHLLTVTFGVISRSSRGEAIAIFAVLALCLPACHLFGSSHVSAGASSGAALALVDYIKQIRPGTWHAAVACLALCVIITWFYSSEVAEWQGDVSFMLSAFLVGVFIVIAHFLTVTFCASPRSSSGEAFDALALFAVLAICLPACHLFGSTHVSASAFSAASGVLWIYVLKIMDADALISSVSKSPNYQHEHSMFKQEVCLQTNVSYAPLTMPPLLFIRFQHTLEARTNEAHKMKEKCGCCCGSQLPCLLTPSNSHPSQVP